MFVLRMMYLYFASVGIASVATDAVSDQLTNFKSKHPRPIGILTAKNGCPIRLCDTNALNDDLMSNSFFMDIMPSLVRERIPERVVHPKAAGAFGYFEVTHNLSDICKAKVFSEVGKKTPIAARFSQTGLDKGEADTTRDSIGYAVKFYTEEGNFDLVALNTPMFSIKDPNIFPTISRSRKRNPATNIRDKKILWDLITLRPESVFFFLYLFGDNGIPDGFRFMPGFSIHTYQVENSKGDLYFVRFHLLPEAGIKNLSAKEADKIKCADPDYAVRDLYNAIENGEYPVWILYVQVVTIEEVKKCPSEIFDVTRILPLKKYPLRPVGKLYLNRNPKNHFAEIEQSAYCPGNLVPGITGAPDRLFQARRFSYVDAQLYRLGANFDKIPVNCPRNKVLSYNRDGDAPIGINGGDTPSYYPNSFNGPNPTDGECNKLINVKIDESYSFDQATELYDEMSEGERYRLIKTIVDSLRLADPHQQKNAIQLFKMVRRSLGQRIAMGLAGRDFS